MHRVRDQRVIEAIAHVKSLLPAKIGHLLQGVDYVALLDPAFIGLHFFQETEDSRLYTETSHCVWPFHQSHLPLSQRKTTVVLQQDSLAFDGLIIDVILHELGHALDEALDFQRPDMKALNSYAATNQYEAFAVAFRAWMNDTRESDGWHRPNREELASLDPRAVAFFNSLASDGTDISTRW